jgi:hypothetical protein
MLLLNGFAELKVIFSIIRSQSPRICQNMALFRNTHFCFHRPTHVECWIGPILPLWIISRVPLSRERRHFCRPNEGWRIDQWLQRKTAQRDVKWDAQQGDRIVSKWVGGLEGPMFLLKSFAWSSEEFKSLGRW